MMNESDIWTINLLPMIALVVRMVIWPLSVLKVYEILRSVTWIVKKGRRYQQEFLTLVKEGEADRSIDLEKLEGINGRLGFPWPFFLRYSHRPSTQTVLQTRIQQILVPVSRFIGKWLHRQPLLVTCLAVFLLGVPDRNSAIFEMVSIISLIMAELLDLLTSRGILGFVDNFRQDFEVDPVDSYKRGSMRWSKTQFVGRFVTGITVFLGSSVLGFAALFFGVYTVWGNCCFRNLLPNVLPQLQFIYFSIVTAATVGYGDISPNCGISQAVAAMECVFSLGVIVALLFALSNTFTHEGG